MAIYVAHNAQVVVQGITGNQGSFHTRQMLSFGTNIVAGVSPGKGGQQVEGIPVYDTVAAACEQHQIDATAIYIPAPFALDAVVEAVDAGIKVIGCITEHIPLHDEIRLVDYARRQGAVVVGPNTFGIVTSRGCKIGVAPNHVFKDGPVGVISRSGTLTYEIVGSLLAQGIGTSTVVGLGGDRVTGLNFLDVLREFNQDDQTKAIIMIGEIGGTSEEEAAEYIRENPVKPVIAYLAGKSAPPGKRMGHAGAIIERGRGTFANKVKALEAANVQVAELLFEVPDLVKKCLIS
ncbi:MAG: succinate--CoA ligase subunit alpha [Bacillota bacterium]|nr:succinate--CoA ligase subunit alpha [Bacillota bacterium]